MDVKLNIGKMRKEKDEHRPKCQCVGIDVSKRKFTATLYKTDFNGWTTHTGSVDFKNDKSGFNQLLKWSRKEATPECALSFLMEATGIYYEGLAYHLHRLGKTLFVVLPNKAKKFAEYQGIKTKTDSVDSYALAWMGCSDMRLRPWSPPSDTLRRLKQMIRMEQALTKQKVYMKGQLEAIENCASPEKKVVDTWKGMMKHIDETIKKNVKHMKELVEADTLISTKIRCLESIPGIGFHTAVAVAAETGGFAMCSSRKQLASYAGLDVPARQSGETDGRRNISKKGNRRIRAILYMPAVSTLVHDKHLLSFYQRIASKNPNAGKVGIIAVERKLLLLMYTLWKKEEMYSSPDKEDSIE